MRHWRIYWARPGSRGRLHVSQAGRNRAPEPRHVTMWMSVHLPPGLRGIPIDGMDYPVQAGDVVGGRRGRPPYPQVRSKIRWSRVVSDGPLITVTASARSPGRNRGGAVGVCDEHRLAGGGHVGQDGLPRARPGCSRVDAVEPAVEAGSKARCQLEPTSKRTIAGRRSSATACPFNAMAVSRLRRSRCS